ncbi:MAG: hypothetical protein JO012_16745 [Hyphomicrobiales bacterium]|nr:hypothetical protein [Hyphomicrobiales bacterium]
MQSAAEFLPPDGRKRFQWRQFSGRIQIRTYRSGYNLAAPAIETRYRYRDARRRRRRHHLDVEHVHDEDYDARLYFYLEVPTAGFFDLQFGFKSLDPNDNTRAMFRRYEAATASNWEAITQDAAGRPVATSFSEGNTNYRRTGIIWLQRIVPPKPKLPYYQVSYYAADQADGNIKSPPNPFAVHTTNLPTVTCQLVPFVSFHSAGQAISRQVWIDQIWLSANK